MRNSIPRLHWFPLGILIAISLVLDPVVADEAGADDASDSAAVIDGVHGDAAMLAVLDRIWEFELIENPSLATNVGDPRGQDRFADDSPQAVERRASRRSAFLRDVLAVDSDSLSQSRRIDQRLVALRLEGQLADHRFQTHLMPINNREGFHLTFPELAREMNPKSVADFHNYIARLNDFGRVVDEQIHWMRQGIAAGLTQPSIILRDSVEQATAHIVDDPNRSLLLTNVPEETRRALGQDWEPIADQIRDAIRTTVVPGYRRMADFLKHEYIPASRDSIGISATPRGAEFYRDRILRFTTLPLTAAEIHQTGIAENARIRAEMQAIVDRVGFDGDLAAFVDDLRTNPKFYAKTSDELMRYVAFILKTADGRLPELFGHLPRIPYGLREVPAYVAPQTTSAYYWPPSTDGKRPGYYYLNTYNLSSRPLYELESLSMHEAVPGHHLQLAIQAELSELHPISRESNFTAFIEGWALYSERLGKEIGFYQDPYQDFGRLSMEAWRASRLVVDTGMHAMGWSRPQAIAYMKDNTALSEHNAVAEIDRYIGWPGQALAYKIGELAISRLRTRAESELGDRFDVRAFHDRVLEAGSIPLPLLEERIDQWIAQQKATP